MDSAALARLCYNAQQFSATSSALGGVAQFATRGDHLTVCASDDYVALVDSAPIGSGAEQDAFHLHLGDVKGLERWLRDKAGAVQLDPAGVSVRQGGATWTAELPADPPDFTPVQEVLDLPPNPFAHSGVPFAIRAERFAKFRLLRTPESPSSKSGYPVDFLWDADLLRFRCGPYLRGVVAPLTREGFVTDSGEQVQGIDDLYATEREEVLW